MTSGRCEKDLSDLTAGMNSGTFFDGSHEIEESDLKELQAASYRVAGKTGEGLAEATAIYMYIVILVTQIHANSRKFNKEFPN